MRTELAFKYRPQTLDEVVGQGRAVSVLQRMLRNGKVHHALLFSGPSGCGKSTLAKIMRRELECHAADYVELNAAEARGIDTVRDIKGRVRLVPMRGVCRVFLMEESHQLTREAQSALLDIVENVPAHAYFFFCTTHPESLLPTLRSRCAPVKVGPLSSDDVAALLGRVLAAEGKSVGAEVVAKLCDCAAGSARDALKLLDMVVDLDDDAERLAALEAPQAEARSIELARELLKDRPDWKSLAKTIDAAQEDPESLRHMVLAYMTKVLLSGGPRAARAAKVIGYFQFSLTDSKKAGLALAAWQACHDRG
jgi:DNA polymerase-3 subunit gamma/tau